MKCLTEDLLNKITEGVEKNKGLLHPDCGPRNIDNIAGVIFMYVMDTLEEHNMEHKCTCEDDHD